MINWITVNTSKVTRGCLSTSDQR